MKLGVYLPPGEGEHVDAFERIALFDFDTREWDEHSEGEILQYLHPDFTPEEFVVRFEYGNLPYRILTPQEVADSEIDVVVRTTEPLLSVEEAQHRREKNGWIPSQYEMMHREEQGIIVVDDDAEIDETKISNEIVRRSNYERFSYEDHFDINFDN